MKQKKFQQLLFMRVLDSDKRELKRVAQQLDLDQAETARRALREGLRVLKKLEFPGARNASSA